MVLAVVEVEEVELGNMEMNQVDVEDPYLEDMDDLDMEDVVLKDMDVILVLVNVEVE